MTNRFLRLAGTVALLALTAPAAWADEISDALQAAQDAYAAADLKTAGEQIAAANTALRAKQTKLLEAFLPEAPEGFTKEISADFAAGFGMFGGGSGAEGRYTSDAGSFTIDIVADNSMVSSMAQMFSSPEMMAMMGTVETVGDVPLILQEQGINAMVGGRVMVSAQGMDAAVMLPAMKAIDFAKLGEFDK